MSAGRASRAESACRQPTRCWQPPVRQRPRSRPCRLRTPAWRRPCADFALGGIGQERRNFRAAGWQRTEQKPEPGAAEIGHECSASGPPATSHTEPLIASTLSFDVDLAARRCRASRRWRTAPRRRSRSMMLSRNSGTPNDKSRLAGELVDAHQPDRKADEQCRQPARDRTAKGGRNGDERQHHQREIFGRAERQRHRSP